MTRQIRVSDPVAEQLDQIAEEMDISRKAAVSVVMIEAGYDV